MIFTQGAFAISESQKGPIHLFLRAFLPGALEKRMNLEEKASIALVSLAYGDATSVWHRH